MSRSYKKYSLFSNTYEGYTKPIRHKYRSKFNPHQGKYWKNYRNSQDRCCKRDYLKRRYTDEDILDEKIIPINGKTLMWDLW